MAASDIERLFDRFFRVESSRACPQAQHFGLGLSIVAAIARMHGGRTFAASEAGLTTIGMVMVAQATPMSADTTSAAAG